MTASGNSDWSELTREAERAGRHYRLVEPENRMVARHLAVATSNKKRSDQQ